MCLLVILLFLSVFVSCPLEAASPQKNNTARQICITFDNLPVGDTEDRIKRLMITDEILGVLDEFGVKAAAFVVGKNIGDDYDLLKNWLAAGHVLGNQTYSYPDLNDVPPTLYLHNVEKCQNIIDSLVKYGNQKEKYFRYPFLHYGATARVKDAVSGYLEKNGYFIAHASLDIDDFAYNLQYNKIYEAYDSLELVRLGNEYIDHVVEKLKRAEELSQELLGRQIRQILLLHTNRLNSSFLPDLLSELKIQGYSFISLEKALDDPAYDIQETYTGMKGLSFLERLAHTNPDLLPAREN